MPHWGAGYRDFFAKYYTRHGAMVAQTENLPFADQTIDLDPNVRDAWGLPAPRVTYDWRRPNERARVDFVQKKLIEIGQAMGGPHVWPTPASPAGRRARTMKAARAWAATRRIPSSTNTARLGIIPICS